MWKEYTKDIHDSVALVGSVKSLQLGLQYCGRPIKPSPVKYVDGDAHPQFDYQSLFFYKNRKLFGHEREFRFLTPVLDSEMPFLLEPRESGRRMVSVNFNVAVKRIVFHPQASLIYKNRINSQFRSIFRRLDKIEDSIFQH